MLISIFSIQVLLASLVTAAPGFTQSDFEKDPYHIAHVTQPMWHFASGSCYPQSATDNGQQHSPHPNSGCILNGIHDAGAGCAFQIPWRGPNQKGVNVPTYYRVVPCGNTYRIYYGLYFDHDQGHRHDWEWVIVVFRKFGDLYYRDTIIMEQDGGNAEYSWKDSHLQTFDDANDMWSNDLGGKDRNHPKIYVTKMHHSMWPNRCTGGIKDDCFGTFRPDDWYMFDFGNESNLVDISNSPNNGGIDPHWNFGSASNPWSTVGSICDMCTTGGEYEPNCGTALPNKCWKEHGKCVCHGPFVQQKQAPLQVQELK